MNNINNDNSGKNHDKGGKALDILQPDRIPDEEKETAGEETPETGSPAGSSTSGMRSKEASLVTQNDDSRIINEIHDIGKQIDRLSDHFEGKLKYDGHKNRIIDELHGQLQEFREGIINKHMLSLITDIIKILDDTRKFKAYYEKQGRAENTADMLLDFLDQITLDLEETFTLQGIYPFTCTQNTFDSARQRIIKKIETSDPGKNGRVARSLRPGYECEGKVIRPEMVSIYIHNDQLNDKAEEI